MCLASGPRGQFVEFGKESIAGLLPSHWMNDFRIRIWKLDPRLRRSRHDVSFFGSKSAEIRKLRVLAVQLPRVDSQPVAESFVDNVCNPGQCLAKARADLL